MNEWLSEWIAVVCVFCIPFRCCGPAKRRSCVNNILMVVADDDLRTVVVVDGATISQSNVNKEGPECVFYSMCRHRHTHKQKLPNPCEWSRMVDERKFCALPLLIDIEQKIWQRKKKCQKQKFVILT